MSDQRGARVAYESLAMEGVRAEGTGASAHVYVALPPCRFTPASYCHCRSEPDPSTHVLEPVRWCIGAGSSATGATAVAPPPAIELFGTELTGKPPVGEG